MNVDIISHVETARPAHHPWIYLNGKLIEAQQASLAITTQAFNYGTAVFEGIRGYAHGTHGGVNIFRLDEHLFRLRQSASLLLIDDLPEHELLKASILALLRHNDVSGDCYIRPIAYKHQLLPGMGFGVKLTGVSSGLSVNTLNMRSYVKQDGLSCAISCWRRVADNAIPARAKITGSYVNSALAMESAQRSGYDDAIMLNSFGYVAEATTANVFMIKQGKIITPPVTAHILEGITRTSVIELVKSHLGLEVEQRDILPSELLTADECFLSGTGIEVSPIKRIEHRILQSLEPNSISMKVRSLYLQAARGELDAFKHWLTPIY